MPDEAMFDELFPDFENRVKEWIEQHGVQAAPMIVEETSRLITDVSRRVDRAVTARERRQASAGTFVHIAIIRELSNVIRHTLDWATDVWTEDNNGNMVLIKDRIDELTKEYVDELSANRSAKQPAASGKQPAVTRQP